MIRLPTLGNVLIGFFIMGLLNLLVVDVWILRNNFFTSSEMLESLKSKSAGNKLQGSVVDQQLCPNSCLTQIYNATISAKAYQLASFPQSNQADSSPNVKEFFVSFGSGSNSTDDWADMPGLQAYIDSSQYGKIKNTIFEASINIPTGNETAYVRLFNVTDKHPVWFSELFLEGGAGQLLVSNPINLDLGKKLYQVQMKTSLKYPADLSQARIHITTY